ncbi:MAG TPA: aldehyde dehydrogenase family protein, partial [Cyclobacteriaceae bacterium]|nr:aldehyde dehydrogenase family protein [Cyclobacteriaceae bacterium]
MLRHAGVGENIQILAEKTDLTAASVAFKRQKDRAIALRSEPIHARLDRLRKLETWIRNNRELIKKAIHADFRKPLLEVDTSEIYPVLTEIRHTVKHLEEWSRPRKIDATLAYIGTRSEIRYEPKGVCLIIAPWNFPFNLCVGPLVSCLAAGNTAMVKPSEMTPHTSALLKEMMAALYDQDLVTVVEGGVETSQMLLTLPFDHIFFTGSPAVGKVVMKAAAANLASVTLELGGKSPTIIDESANLPDAAKRIAFGKFINNGQTCIAPDYVMVHQSVKEQFVSLLKTEIQLLFNEGKPIDEQSVHYARIVNAKHFQRLNGLLNDAVEQGAKPETLGIANASTNFFPPVLLTHVPASARIMDEEIFGPILPVLTFANSEEVIEQVNRRPKPLALYIFSSRKTFKEYILKNTSAGGVCINECILQFTHPNLPFGGVNNSGIGKSHGFFGFLAFSNEKPILRQKSGWSGPYLLHPPYTQRMK